MHRRGLVLVLALVAAACGPTEYKITNETLCLVLSTAVCTRANECGTAPSLKDCELQFAGACCVAATCPLLATADETALYECALDMTKWSCDSLAADTLPPSCPPSPGGEG